MLKLKLKDIFYLVLYAIPNTILSFAIVYIINNVLSGNEQFLEDYMGIVFVSTIVFTYLLNVIFQKHLNLFSFDLLYKNEKRLFNQILNASLEKLEKLGSQRFFTAVEDIRIFSQLPYTITHAVNSLLMLILCLAYMFTLSVASAFIVIGLMVLVATCYFVVMNSMSKQVAQLRKYNEYYFQYVDDVMKGFKELKLSFFRRENLLNKFLFPNRDQAKELDFKINYIFLSINLISQYGLYFVIAVILFALPALNWLPREDVISYVVIILFISGPINNLINLQQMFTRFMVANTRVKNFMVDFEITDHKPVEMLSETSYFDKVEFEDVCYSYENDNSGEKSFSLGPINLEINKGETIFIVGGNGSGKSTFINTLTGLYEPSRGEVILNNTKGGDAKNNLQNLISAVFTNNHLFSKNYDDYELENNKEYHALLKTMRLEKVITDDKEESARRNFSKGQSKRMSLIFALLEKKPILVLDEWAADQDPHFRKYFYEELIPKLKQQGKTIIAVTHDDAYFNQADRIIKFNYGQIEKDMQVKKDELVQEDIWV